MTKLPLEPGVVRVARDVLATRTLNWVKDGTLVDVDTAEYALWLWESAGPRRRQRLSRMTSQQYVDTAMAARARHVGGRP